MNMLRMNCDLPDNLEKEEIPTPPPEPILPSGFIDPQALKELIRIVIRVGKGSFGSAWKIVYKPNGDYYLMKVIRTTIPSVRGMAIQEAKFGMGFSHTNVCQTYAWSEDEDMVYIIMEYIEGMDLFEFISKKQGIFQKNTSLFWLIVNDILHGLAAIHQKGIVHCDLKPENVLIGLSPDGETIISVKIIDFGLSRPIHEIQHSTAGTHDYMAPEVARQTEKDFSLDIWSVGILMYAMFMTEIPSQIHSRNPNKKKRKAEVIQNLCRLTTDDFKPFIHISRQLRFSRIQEFIISCLQVNRIDRPTLQALLAKIDEFFPPEPIKKKDA
jgi:serine/threonine protein kinase